MIGMLTGRVESVDSAAALIDVGGVGYEVRMPSADLSAIHAGQEHRVYTSLSVSQDAVTLFGFLSPASKRMFLRLQKVSGVGPKVALSLLSVLPADRLAKAIADGDAKALTKAPGLGNKGAQKIILELKGSIDLEQLDEQSAGLPAPDTGAQQVVEGLMSLGWSQQDAHHAVETVRAEQGLDEPLRAQDVPNVLRLALASLDRGR